MERVVGQHRNAIRWSLGMVCAALAIVMPASAVGQQDSASIGPPPHFMAAWAPPGTFIDVSRTGVLRQRISVDLSNVPLREAIARIRDEAGLNLVYHQQVVPADRTVSLRANGITVASALADVLMDTGLDVAMTRGGQLALIPCPHLGKTGEDRGQGVIAGRVLDRSNGKPIVGAIMAVDGTSLSATTDASGQYRIAGVPAGARILTAKSIGYDPARVAVQAGPRAVTRDFLLERSVQELEQLVVTGTVVPTEVKAIPSPITVITADEIRRQNVQRVDQLFRGLVPGTFAWDQTADDYFSTINVRGASSLTNKPVKVLIDGIDLANPQYIATIDPNSIERIELTRGPQASTIYGSGAIGGVMQIFTKKGRFGLRRPEGEGTASIGVIGGYQGGQTALATDETLTFFGGGERTRFGLMGYYRYDGPWVPSYSNTNWSVTAAGENIEGPLTARFTARYASKTLDRQWYTALRDSGYVRFSKPPFETIDQTAQTYGANLLYVARPWWTHELLLGYDRFTFGQFQTQPRFTTPDDSLLFITTADNDKVSIFYSTTVGIRPNRSFGAVLTAGVNHYDANLNQTSTVDAVRIVGTIVGTTAPPLRLPVSNSGIFAQTQVDLAEKVFLTAGLRAEWNSSFGEDFGVPLSPRAGIAYVQPIGPTTAKFRFAFGESIRPPDPSQSQAIPGAQVDQIPNPNLGPERQRGWDGGLEIYWGSQLFFGATYYRQRAVDLIDQVIIGSSNEPPRTQVQLRNVGEIDNDGWEFEGRLTLERFLFSGAFSITNSTIRQLSPTLPSGGYQVGDRVRGIPRITAGATASYMLSPRTMVTGTMAHADDWIENNTIAFFGFLFGGIPFRGSDRAYWMQYPGFTKFNVSVEQQVARRLGLIVRLDNVTNDRAYELENLITPTPRTLTFGVRAVY